MANSIVENFSRVLVADPMGSDNSSSETTPSTKMIDCGKMCRQLRDILVQDLKSQQVINKSLDSESEQKINNFLDCEDYIDAFLARNEIKGKRRRGKMGGNIFHHLVKESCEWEESELTKVLQWLLDDSKNVSRKKKPSRPFTLLLEEEWGKETAMHMALTRTYNNRLFVKVMLTKLQPQPANLAKILCMPLKELKADNPSGSNCLHLAIQGASSFVLEIIELAEKFSSESLQKQGYWSPFVVKDADDGNTPLHLAVIDFEVGSEEAFRCRIDGTNECANLRKELETMTKTFIRPLIERHHEVLEKRNTAGRTPYQERIWCLAQSIEVRNTIRQFRERATQLNTPNTYWQDGQELRSGEFRKIIIADPVASLISYYCIGHLNGDEINRCLYNPGEERSVYFHPAQGPSISQNFFSSLSFLQFERTLKYVCIPRAMYEPENSSYQQSKVSTISRGREDLKHIFNWLYKQNVRKILKVITFDDELPCHEDSAIVDCLKPFDVEEWDWMKVDLSIEVIKNSTQKARQISLYSSGNPTVLQEWSAKGGFDDEQKFRDLELITVYLREGQEDMKTLQNFGESFKRDLSNTLVQAANERSDDGNKNIKPIEIRYKVVPPPIRILNSRGIGASDPSGHRRITEIKRLTKFLRNNRREESSPWIKIAIIDNGFDSLLDLLATENSYAKIAADKSFLLSSSNPTSSYISTGEHGTQIASLICAICPNTLLYIARIMEETNPNGVKHVNSESAAEAVTWAMRCGVDIINMGWTIETNNKDGGLENLLTATEKAKTQRIVMFCSGNQSGGGPSAVSYPGYWKSCVRIGSISESDLPLSWVQTNEVDFMLPGENITVKSNNGTLHAKTGNAWATAIATGLGGLLIYCTRILGIDYSLSRHEGKPDTQFSGELDFFWNYELMNRAFYNFSGPWHQNGERKLAKPEEYIIERFKKALKDRIGPLRRPLEDENLDSDVEDALKEVILNLKVSAVSQRPKLVVRPTGPTLKPRNGLHPSR